MKLELLEDGKVIFSKTYADPANPPGPTPSPGPTPPPNPPPPPTPQPVPSGEPLVWEQRYQFGMAPGGERVFIATIGANVPGVGVNIMGVTNETDATFTWTFPDGRIFPAPEDRRIYSTAGAGRMGLVGKAGGWIANIPDLFIPPGQHVLKIQSTGRSSLVMIAN